MMQLHWVFCLVWYIWPIDLLQNNQKEDFKYYYAVWATRFPCYIVPVQDLQSDEKNFNNFVSLRV